MYSPTLGRWLQTDPVGYDDTASLYQADRGNPVASVDPSGCAAKPLTRPAVDAMDEVTEMPLVDLGTGSVRVRYRVVDTRIPGDNVYLQTWIEFWPNPDKCPKCKTIRFIQAYQLYRNEKYAVVDRQVGFEGLKTAENKDGQVEEGWILDFDGKGRRKGDKLSPYYSDNFGKRNDQYNPDKDVFNRDGRFTANTKAGRGQAQMLDDPHIHTESDFTFNLETAIVCEETGAYLGSISWGFTHKRNGETKVNVPTKVPDGPSPSFRAALSAFTDFFGSKVATGAK